MRIMRTEIILSFRDETLRPNFRLVMVRVLKGVLVAASVCITASVVSKEETINPGTREGMDFARNIKAVEEYPGIDGEVTEEADSILELMENDVALRRAALEEREIVEVEAHEERESPAVKASAVRTEETAGPGGEDVSGPDAGVTALTFEGTLPMDYCVGSKVDLSGITLMYGGTKINLEDALVEIPDTGTAGTYCVVAKYEGSKVEIPFGVVDYKVRLDGNGGTCPEDTAYLTDYMLGETAVPVRLGKEFTGWYRDEACTIPFEGAKRGEVELTLYAGWKDFDGVLCDESGYITKYTGINYEITDGLLVLPNREGCVGIRAGALDGLEEKIFEIYVPAGITDIEPAAFQCLPHLFYIEVHPDNPIYVSEAGVLYSRVDGSVVVWPGGR